MINIKQWWKEANKRCEAFVVGVFDALIRRPLLNAMVDNMKRRERECRVNLFVHGEAK